MFSGILFSSVWPSPQKAAVVFTPWLCGSCSSEGAAEKLQETNRMSVGGQMREGRIWRGSFARVCVCVLIPGRTSSGSELPGSSGGVGSRRLGEGRVGEEWKTNRRSSAEDKKNEGGRRIKGRGSIESHFKNMNAQRSHPPTLKGCNSNSLNRLLQSVSPIDWLSKCHLTQNLTFKTTIRLLWRLFWDRKTSTR